MSSFIRCRFILRILLGISLAAPVWAQTVAIRAGNLIDPATGTVAKNQIILVKDKKILEVGPNVAIPNGAETVDLSSEWVMPGVMDAHTHITQSVQYFRELDANLPPRRHASARPPRTLDGTNSSERRH